MTTTVRTSRNDDLFFIGLGAAAGVAVVFARAKGDKCARSWRYTSDVGSDPDYPEVSARDAAALHELRALGRL